MTFVRRELSSPLHFRIRRIGPTRVPVGELILVEVAYLNQPSATGHGFSIDPEMAAPYLDGLIAAQRSGATYWADVSFDRAVSSLDRAIRQSAPLEITIAEAVKNGQVVDGEGDRPGDARG